MARLQWTLRACDQLRFNNALPLSDARAAMYFFDNKFRGNATKYATAARPTQAYFPYPPNLPAAKRTFYICPDSLYTLPKCGLQNGDFMKKPRGARRRCKVAGQALAHGLGHSLSLGDNDASVNYELRVRSGPTTDKWGLLRYEFERIRQSSRNPSRELGPGRRG